MNYFTKYLVVEGEIKQGDMALKPAFTWGDNKEHYEAPYFELCNTSEDEDDYKYYKLAKLFLCSNDIKVGDTVYLESHNITSKVIEMVNNSTRDVILENMPHGGTLDHRQLIKVLGEVSSEAIWITENMEFTEDKFKVELKEIIKCTCQESPHFPWKNPTCKYLVEHHHGGGESCMRKEPKTIIKFKCSCCNTFK